MNDQDDRQVKNAGQQDSGGSIEHGRGRRRHRNRPPRTDSVNMDELRELIALVRENGFGEFEYEREGFRVKFRKEAEISGGQNFAGELNSSAASSGSTQAAGTDSASVEDKAASAPAHRARAATKASEDQDLQIIPSPIVGTFYRSPSPNAESFVKIGSHVEPDTVVCIIEAMKLMNEIQAEATGEVAKIYVENGQPVEYGQPLFGIKK